MAQFRHPQFRHPSLEGRTVLVTGGGRGLGRSMALALARAGARVAILGRSTAEQQAVAAEARAAVGAPIVPLVADVREAAQAERAVREAVDALGSLQVLVNNAGIGLRAISETFNTKPVPFWEGPVEGWRSIVEANVLGPFHFARVAAPLMVRAGFGRIINVSTSPPTMVRKGYSPYGPSKAALEAMTRVWSQDLEGSGVTVNALLPGGATDTALLPGAGPGRRGADGQLLPVHVMDNALLWLASDLSGPFTGRRVVGKLWDDSLPPEEAAAKAMPPAPASPGIL